MQAANGTRLLKEGKWRTPSGAGAVLDPNRLEWTQIRDDRSVEHPLQHPRAHRPLGAADA